MSIKESFLINRNNYNNEKLPSIILIPFCMEY